MNLLKFVAGQSEGVSDLTNPALWLENALFGGSSKAGVDVNHNSAFSVAVYAACIKNISEDVAKLPFILYQRTPAGKERRRDHRVHNLIHDRPNGEMSAMNWRETVQADAMGYGNGYSEIERDRGLRPVALHYISPPRVKVIRLPSNDIAYEVKPPKEKMGEEPKIIPAPDMFHIHGLGGDGLQGWSILRMAMEALGISIAAQNFGATFFGNGAHAGGVLEHPGKLKPESKKALREAWERIHRGSDNAHKTAVLEQGMKFNRISIPPNDAQFIQSRQFQVEEIIRWFRMPPHKVQHLLRSTFNNIEHQSLEYDRDTIGPWCKRWEEEVHEKLLSKGERATLFAKHLLQALLSTDHKTRAEFYSKQFNIGALNQNEIRELEDRNAIGSEGDVYYVPRNLQPVRDALREMDSKLEMQKARAEEAKAQKEAQENNEDDEPANEENENASVTVTIPSLNVAKFAPAIEHASKKCMAKQAKAAERALAKKQAREDFVEWVQTFTHSQQKYVLEMVWPLVESVALATNSTPDQIASLKCDLTIHCASLLNDQKHMMLKAYDDGVKPDWENAAQAFSQCLALNVVENLQTQKELAHEMG